MIWIEALAKLLFIMIMLGIIVTAAVVIIAVIRALIEAWRRKK